jgi:Raf kinase inhibitor-like YbhB/YbcL family protein
MLPDAAGGRIPQAAALSSFGCTGENQSLAVTWEGAPPRAKSFAITVHDPDAPTGVGFFHWTVFDLPAGTGGLAAGASRGHLPAGAVEGYTDFGQTGYGGPCPPPGETHRYFVTVYALDEDHLGAPAATTGASLRFQLRGHTVALGRATALYARP